jgi:hypothetical protein
MRLLALTIGLFAAAMPCAIPQTTPRRMIDQCAQDGLFFYSIDDDTSKPISVDRDGVAIRIERTDPKGVDAVVTFSRNGHSLKQAEKDFEASMSWLTVSSSGPFATTWKINASSADTQLFELTSKGDIVEDSQLLKRAERIFESDAKRHCRMPGKNTTAIKWIDATHLLVSINAWASGFCYSNFTEGFILDIPAHTIQRKLTNQQLIDLPAVCTWNIVPVGKHQ